MADEFTIIHTYFLPLTEGKPAALGLKDDAAVIGFPPGKQAVITKDVLVENVHFFAGDDPALLAKKALRTNFSDLAAMGASPTGYFLGLVLPKQVKENWIAQFCAGLKEDNQHFGVALLGGDTTASDSGVVISVTVIGEVPEGMALTRNGAQAGDKIYVSGTIGDSALGLLILQGKAKPADKYLVSRYHLPLPRVTLGGSLHGIATSAMDISDGLVQDLGHIAESSSVGAEIYADKVPLSEAVASMLSKHPALLENILTGGDDYELLFTLPPAKEKELVEIAANIGVNLTCIGSVTQGTGVTIYDKNGSTLQFKQTGYKHF